jgi:hypothetical protein
MKIKKATYVTLNTIKKHIAITLFIAFAFTSLHLFFHNNFDHKHDNSCSVYVLEQLYFSTDVVALYLLFIAFLPFTLYLFIPRFYRFTAVRFFHIRAPPEHFFS